MYVPYDPEKMTLEAELYDLTLKKIELELCVTIMCRNDELSCCLLTDKVLADK